MKDEIGQQLEQDGFRYVQSHQNDPLGCAIASEVLKVIREDDLVNRSERLGRELIGRLRKLKEQFVSVKDDSFYLILARNLELM